MARKVLISFLGTGGLDKNNTAERTYRKAKYKIDEVEYETSFIAAALSKHLQIDTFIFIGTMKSMWEEVYKHFSEKEDDYFWRLVEYSETASFQSDIDESLFEDLEKILGNDSKIIPIKYGLNEKELSYNLSVITKIENLLKEGDDLYVDITHSFRSLSIFLMTALIYLRDVSSKKLYLKGIFYGMLDVINELNYAPIVDLSIVSNTMEWIKGAYTFDSFGNAELITKLLGEQNEVSKKLNNFSKAVSINYASTIKNQIENFKKLKLDDLELPASLIVPQIVNDFIDNFKNAQTDSQFQIELADWYAKKHIYSSSYIVLAEAIITYVCEQDRNLKNDISDKNNRTKAKSFIIENNYDNINDNNYFITINSIRNDIGHATIDKRNSMLQDITDLPNRIKRAKKIIYQK